MREGERERREARRLVREVASEVAPGYGCRDAGCVFGCAGGMGTNGGCHCLVDGTPQEIRMRGRALAAVAQALAERIVRAR